MVPSIFFLLRLTAAQPPSGELPDHDRVTPTMAVIIAVLVALFLLGFFPIYIRHCSVSQSAAAAGSSIRRAATAASRGLDPAVIETFPTMVYSAVKGLKIGKAAPECAVCLSEFHDGETLRFIPKCDHVFHPECIDAWLESHATCPVCRASFGPHDGSTAVEPETIAPASASDLEAGRVDGGTLSEPAAGGCRSSEERPPEVFWFDWFLNRNHESRSHSAGHSLVQPGGDTDRVRVEVAG